MIYIDSDGVLSDFDQWLVDKNCKNYNDSIEVYKTTIKFQDEAFLASKPIKENNWVRNIMKTSDFRILTSLPNKDDFRQLFDSDEDFEKCFNKLKENKYKWFENIGVSRDKVIIVESRREKFEYCKSRDDILYDDFPDTVKTWKDYGGRAYLVKNSKSRAQKERYQLYAIKNFDNIKNCIRKGLKRHYLSQCFKKYYPVKDYYDCYEIAELDTNYAIKEIVSKNIKYNPYKGKVIFTDCKAKNLLVRTGSNEERTLETYLFNCFPVLFEEPIYYSQDNGIDTVLAEFIPNDLIEKGMKLKKLY